MNSLIKTQLLNRKPWLIFLFNLITSSLYSCYWFYKMFKAVGDKRPVLKTILIFIYVFELFPKLYKSVGKNNSAQPIVFALIYLLVSLGSLSLLFLPQDGLLYVGFYFANIVIVSLVICKLQKVVYTSATVSSRTKYSKPELAWITGGIFCFLLVVTDIVLLAPQHVIDARYAEIDKRFYAAEKVQKDLYQKNEACVAQRNEEFKTLDQSNQGAVDNYNTAVETCDKIFVQYEKAVDEYTKITPDYFRAILRNY